MHVQDAGAVVVNGQDQPPHTHTVFVMLKKSTLTRKMGGSVNHLTRSPWFVMSQTSNVVLATMGNVPKSAKGTLFVTDDDCLPRCIGPNSCA